MTMPMVSEAAAKFWAEDLNVIERRYLGGREVCGLPASKLDDRVPNQGTVLIENVVSIEDVVGRPTWRERFAAGRLYFKRYLRS